MSKKATKKSAVKKAAPKKSASAEKKAKLEAEKLAKNNTEKPAVINYKEQYMFDKLRELQGEKRDTRNKKNHVPVIEERNLSVHANEKYFRPKK